MNKKESIQKIQDQIDKVKEYLEYGMPYSEYLDLQLAFEDIVNLIQKQEEEIKRLKEDISNMYDEKVVRNILEDECGLSKYEIDEILN